MQLHPTPFSVPWHSGGDSELSMPLGHLSRHYSTDRSSSLGSMESLENPSSQGYYDNQLSPIDPAIFNNKRDSAYSSFSASSNTSDYTVSLRPEENSSMDSLLQGFGPSCRFTDVRPHSAASAQEEQHCEEPLLKSRSLLHKPEVKVRPSSYSCEDEKRGPPQPPTRKDSFRATRGHTVAKDQRCASVPVGIPSLNNCTLEDVSHTPGLLNEHVCFNGEKEKDQNLKQKTPELSYSLNSQSELCREITSTEEWQKGNHVQSIEQYSSKPYSHTEVCPHSQLNNSEKNIQSRMHRHSAPEKLLVSQLCMIELTSEKDSKPLIPSSTQCPTPHPEGDMQGNSPDVVAQSKWSGSRCSTPGSVITSELEEQGLEEELVVSSQSHTPKQHFWGRATSVPSETPRNGFSGAGHFIESQIQERDFGTISAASSMDTLLEENQECDHGSKDEGEISKLPQKRHFRSSQSRRRSDRFATNLRNEIQRKKAQLQKSRAPGGLICDNEMLEEEDGALHHQPQAISLDQNPEQSDLCNSQAFTSFQARTTDINLICPNRCCRSNIIEHLQIRNEVTQHAQADTSGMQSTEVSRRVGVCVVEELAPPGKARRWRWTPEHKLQPETMLNERRNNGEQAGKSSWNSGPPRGRVGSTGGRASRSDDCDILPFADRRKFFEETSKNLSQSVTNLTSLTGYRQRPENLSRKNSPSSPEPHESVSGFGRRRFSYQGGVHDGGNLVSSLNSRDQQTKKTLERELEKKTESDKDRLREKEHETLKDMERLQTWKQDDEQEHELAQERARKEAEKEQQRVQQLERGWENRENIYLGHDLSKSKMLPPLPHETYSKQPRSFQNVPFHNSHPENVFSKSNHNIPKPCSAFRPVTSQHNQSDHYMQYPGYKTQSCTPTEAYPVQKLEQTKLNRKFSLTERDYALYGQDSRPGEVSAGLSSQVQRNSSVNNSVQTHNNEDHQFVSSALRNRAMSENDIRIDTEFHCGHIGSTANARRINSSVLRELDENIVPTDEVKKKRGPPPPRPPPPKWNQFHMRRASHHNLFTSQSTSYSQPQACIPCPPSVPEMTRQRSYSLPPRDGMECQRKNYQECPSDRHSPVLMHKTFKPVTLPTEERNTPRSLHYDTNNGTDTSTPPLTESLTRASEQYRPDVVKPVIHKHRAEWDLTSHNFIADDNSCQSAGPMENGTSTGPIYPETYFTINHKYQQHMKSQPQPPVALTTSFKNQEVSAQRPFVSEEQTLPFETDIDEFRENEGAAVEQQRQTEMQCFAQPVTVLETDIDTVANEEAKRAGLRRGERQSIVESLMEEDCSRAQKELMGELFPHYTQTGSQSEGWRGGYTVNVDTLERSSRQSSSALHGSASTSNSTSTNKAQLLNKMPNFSEIKEENEELNYKRQLIESLKKKLGVLREAQRGLQEDIRANTQLGEEVESLVLAVCKPNEVEKFRMFIGDLDKVTSLLLSLSARLLRVESALDVLDPESGHCERLPLMEKKKQLLVQLAEAQELKEHVDRREEAVGRVLGRCLTPEQLRDYSHFVKMKAALLVEQRQLDDKIRLGEEQLRGLKESLGLGYGPF